MATNKDPIFLNSVSTGNASFINGDGTSPKVVFTAGADAGAVLRLSATSTDVGAVIVVLAVSDGTLSVVIGEVTVPITAGTDGTTPATNLFDVGAMPGVFQADGSLALGPTATLSVNMKVATTGTVAITAQGGQYAV